MKFKQKTASGACPPWNASRNDRAASGQGVGQAAATVSLRQPAAAPGRHSCMQAAHGKKLKPDGDP